MGNNPLFTLCMVPVQAAAIVTATPPAASTASIMYKYERAKTELNDSGRYSGYN